MLKNLPIHFSVKPVGSLFFLWRKTAANAHATFDAFGDKIHRHNILIVDLIIEPDSLSLFVFFFVSNVVMPKEIGFVLQTFRIFFEYDL